MQLLLKIISIFFIASILFSCGNKINQNSMFTGRSKTKKNRGLYNVGMNNKSGYNKLPSKQAQGKTSSRDNINPKKDAKKKAKVYEKKERTSAKARNKYNRKRHVKTKTTKGKTSGES